MFYFVTFLGVGTVFKIKARGNIKKELVNAY